MSEVAVRDYAEEKKLAYEACLRILDGRPRSAKKDAIQIAEIRDESGLDPVQAANAMKWLKRKELADTDPSGKIGWFITRRLPKTQLERFCWEHGMPKILKGRGKTRRLECQDIQTSAPPS